MIPRRHALRLFLAALAPVSAAALGGCSAFPSHAAERLVDVQIVDRSRGNVLPQVWSRGTPWVAGRPGDRYAVRLTNRSAGRVLVVLSVDGVNAVTGQTAEAGQGGYVLAPWQSADITGWRKSDAEAAAFYFTALPDSYAARTGRPGNVGVIGAAVFRERVPTAFSAPPRYRHGARDERDEERARPEPARPFAQGRGEGSGADEAPARQAAEAAASRAPSPAAAGDTATALSKSEAAPATAEREVADASRRNDRLGTGHGEREYAPVERTSFVRATSRPAEIVSVRYDSHANLVAAGVIAAPRPRWVPDPFPGYVPDPQ